MNHDIPSTPTAPTPLPYAYKYPRPAVTADALVLHFTPQHIRVLLIQRGGEPFKGAWALPGGFLDVGQETLAECALRELKEETGLQLPSMLPLCTRSHPQRDPRGVVISEVYIGCSPHCSVKAADDAAQAQWFDIHSLPPLAFDHAEIIQHALRLLTPSPQHLLIDQLLQLTHYTEQEKQHIYQLLPSSPSDDNRPISLT